jgi:hypothetical protein
MPFAACDTAPVRPGPRPNTARAPVGGIEHDGEGKEDRLSTRKHLAFVALEN